MAGCRALLDENYGVFLGVCDSCSRAFFADVPKRTASYKREYHF